MFRESVGSAFFWPSDEGAPEPGSRVLQGELEVKKSLKLGFLFPRFSVRVSLFAAMYPHRLHTPTSHLCGHILPIPICCLSLVQPCVRAVWLTWLCILHCLQPSPDPLQTCAAPDFVIPNTSSHWTTTLPPDRPCARDASGCGQSHSFPRCPRHLSSHPARDAADLTCDVIPLQYALVLSQFEAPGFAPAASGSVEPLISERVTITSLNAPGIVPRSYAPPGYVHEHEGDYNTAMGYLENGNQRCVSPLCFPSCREAEARPPSLRCVRVYMIRARLRRPGLAT